MKQARTSRSPFCSPKYAPRRAAYSIAAVGSLLLAGALPASPALAAGAGAETGFQPYKDAHAGFALSKPDGWQVRTQDLSIWVESPDKSELVLTRAFTPEAGQSAAQWLSAQPKFFDTFFPQGALDHVQKVETQAGGDEVVVDMHYRGPKGTAKARVLCRIVNGKGLLYLFAAPTARYRAEQPKMLHVARSLVFLVPRKVGKGGGKGGSGGGSGLTAQQIAERSIHWVKWTDPTEHAFQISVPQGWNVKGGIFHNVTSLTLQQWYIVESPQKDITILVDCPAPLHFHTPTQTDAYVGNREGQNGLLHYMRAPEFNAMYLHEIVGKGINDLKLGEGQESAPQSQREADQLNQQFGALGENCKASVGLTPFQGTDSVTGKHIAGIVFSNTKSMASATQPDSGTWWAEPKLVSSQVGDAQEATRTQTAIAVFFHVQQSFAPDPQWVAALQQQNMDQSKAASAQYIAQANANTAAAGERSQQIAANSAAAQDAIMGRFGGQSQASSQTSSGQPSPFANFIGNNTNVSGSDGQKYNIASGFSHYYQNGQTGTIIGTDSAYSPGVDFTPMKEQ